MAERPEPVRDLDWEPQRARAFVDAVADIYEELLTRLPDLPVIVHEGLRPGAGRRRGRRARRADARG